MGELQQTLTFLEAKDRSLVIEALSLEGNKMGVFCPVNLLQQCFAQGTKTM